MGLRHSPVGTACRRLPTIPHPIRMTLYALVHRSVVRRSNGGFGTSYGADRLADQFNSTLHRFGAYGPRRRICPVNRWICPL
jgi:hypothetical protein